MTKRDIVHIEFPAHVPAESQSFYNALCGWDFVTNEEFGYSWSESGNVVVALPKADNEFVQERVVLVYIHSDDIDADLQKVESLGGKIVTPKMDVPGMGAFAIFNDPAGNTVGFWQKYA